MALACSALHCEGKKEVRTLLQSCCFTALGTKNETLAWAALLFVNVNETLALGCLGLAENGKKMAEKGSKTMPTFLPVSANVLPFSAKPRQPKASVSYDVHKQQGSPGQCFTRRSSKCSQY